MIRIKNTPLVSVIMSEYNTDESLLRNSIRSILNQTYNNIEIIIIDDGSRNDTRNIVNDFNDPRIRILKNNKNMGLVFSLNKAASLAKGKYIARMDTDDFAYPDRIEKQVVYMETNPKCDIVASNVVFYSDKIWGRTSRHGEVKRSDLLYGNPINHPTVLMRKSFLKKIGGYPNYYRCEDYALWIRAIANGNKIYIMSQTLLKYHLCKRDYKKKTLKNRLAYLKLIDGDYRKLEPTSVQIFKIKAKTIIAGLTPSWLLYLFHLITYRKGNGKRNNNNN